MEKRRSFLGKVVKSRFLVLTTTVFLILFLIGFVKSFWRDYQIRQEIKQMEKIRAGLEEKKIKTLGYLNELESDSFAEREARLDFGLAKPGEKVVIIADETKKIEKDDGAEKNKKTSARPSNFILWWNYFFGKK